MAQQGGSNDRPALHISRSFTRMPVSPSATSPRERASTLQEAGIPAVPEARHIEAARGLVGKRSDVFENRDDDDDEVEGPTPSGTQPANPELKLPTTFDELPIEIRSLTERFLDGLGAKVHDKPVTADALSDMFQDFYERAASHIATHIASLASRMGRERRPGASGTAAGRKRAGSGAKRSEANSHTNGGGEMLTASEVTDRRKARRLLELKRIALEEAVERAACERIYDAIFQYKSTDDEARDEKLRSRTAALALVGVGLKELHMDSDPAKESARKTAVEKEDEINLSLADAREALQKMNDEHYPAGKLQHLTAAHKSIVETLSQLFPSSSSADEVLPTLIYTLITSPAQGINIVSNLNFIQRFRASSKVDGEAAYCLVNLEAAISFLETVDLSSLRADELPQGPPKAASRPITPTDPAKEKALPVPAAKSATLKPPVSPVSVTVSDTGSGGPNDAAKAPSSSRTPPSLSHTPTLQQRRLSSLVQAQADRLEAGRDEFLKTADKIYDSINGTLDNSLQFVFGRFKEQAAGASPMPKTLEDARKLVSSSAEDHDETLSISGRSSPALDDPLSGTSGKGDTKLIDQLVGGKKPLREHSVDSTRSGGSGKRGAFDAANNSPRPKDEQVASPSGNLLNAINPLNKFAMPGFARFGRTNSNPSTPVQSGPATELPSKLEDIVESPVTADTAEPFPSLDRERTRESVASDGEELNAREALAGLRKIKPPKRRFLEIRNAGELRLVEVEELLMDYRRLAKAIGEAVAT